MTSEIDKLKHFYIEDYSGIYFTDELNNGEEFLYTTIRITDDKEVTFLCKYVKNKHIEACPNCAFNNYFCHGLLCNTVVLKVIKEPDGSIHYNGAFNKRPISIYNFDTKEWTDNKNPICWHGGFVGNLGLSKKLWKKYTEAIYKYRTNTGKMTANDYTHLFGYLNPYYRSAYNVSKRRK